MLLIVPFHPEASLVGAAYHFAPPALDPYVWGVIEWGGNIASFAALSAVLCLIVRPRYAFLMAMSVSAACEIAQLVIPDRQASIADFALNTLGAAVAAGVCAAVTALHRTFGRQRAVLPNAVH